MGLKNRLGGNKKAINKKAIYFMTDAIFASILLIAGVVLISQARFYEPEIQQMDFLGEDLLMALDAITLNEIYLATSASPIYDTSLFTFVRNKTIDQNITDLNKTILEQIAIFWASNETEHANNMTRFAVQDLIPEGYGIELWMRDLSGLDERLFYNDVLGEYQSLITARRMISGVAKYEPITGSTSIAYLKKIEGKKTHSYAYFGGFVGQGNVTVTVRDLPSDFSADNVTDMWLRLDAEGPFDLYINGVLCEDLSLFYPTLGNFTVDEWNITNCSGLTDPGENEFKLVFTNLNTAYVAGGYVKISYTTSEFQHGMEYGNGTYHFPEIRGIVNLYDAFYIPGNLENMSVHLRYLANHTNHTNPFYFKIGNRTILVDSISETTQIIDFNDAELRALLDNYTVNNISSLPFNEMTIPIRMGFENLTYQEEATGAADVGLVTDVSGSMEWRMDWCYSSCSANCGWGWGDCYGEERDCTDTQLYDLDTERLSVAKCLDKNFTESILDIQGNQISLVAYETDTVSAWNLPLTDNLSRAKDTINLYTDLSSTCICCGINDQKTLLTQHLKNTTLITAGEDWLWNTNNFLGPPNPDGYGREWYEPDYTDAGWEENQSILGHDVNELDPQVITELGENTAVGTSAYANLWEYKTDVPGPPNDFTSEHLNMTEDTFGVSENNDGWDFDNGTYNFPTPMSSISAVQFIAGKLVLLFNNAGAGNKNTCPDYDCSAARGITVNITDEMINILNNGGTAKLSFYYQGGRYTGYPFEDDDQAWVKAKWIEPDGTEHWLGEDLDLGQDGADSSPEVCTTDNPNIRCSGIFLGDLSDWINESGLYYLHFGGKLLSSKSVWYDVQADERGYFTFDNIQLRITNTTEHYYFRKHFDIDEMDDVKRGVLNILADDIVNVYINGQLFFEGTEEFVGDYWNRRGIFVPGQGMIDNPFVEGDNVVAVELINNGDDAKFDLALNGINNSRQGAMLVMTDGEANIRCDAEQGTGNAITDAIEAACDAREDWGIQVFAVGMSDTPDEDTLAGIAECGEGTYVKSNNSETLLDFYNDVAINIISSTRQSQLLEITGTPPPSIIYDDSYIKFNYTPIVSEPGPKEILVTFETDQFENCTPGIYIYPGLRVFDAQIVSFSGEHWTDLLMINDTVVYNLTQFNDNYTTLGDPFMVDIPVDYLTPGVHSLNLSIGDYAGHNINCSPNNTLIYSALINSSTARTGIVPEAEGCNWTIEFEDGTFINVFVPADYDGNNTCNFTNDDYVLGSVPDIIANDAYNLAVYQILEQLDFDDDGRVLLNLRQEDFEIVVTLARNIPYMWGPSMMEVRIWK